MANRIGAALKAHKILFVVLTLALLARVVYLVQYSQAPEWGQLTVDNWYHHNWALSIADGNVVGDTTYFRAPLYVYCLSLLYALVGASFWTARLFGLTIGMASVAMTYLITRRLTGRNPALAAAAIHAVYPIAIYFESELLLDPLFTLLTQLGAHRLLIWLESRCGRDLFASGLLFGLAAVTRPTILIVAPLTAVWLIVRAWRRRDRRSTVAGQIGLLVGGMAVCILPVAARNLAVAGDPVLISSQGGINLYIGNNDEADGLTAALPEPLGHNWQIRQVRYLAETASGHALKPGQISDFWRGRAVDWMTSHPVEFASLLWRKLVYQFADREISNNRALRPYFESQPLLRWNPLSFGLIFPLALIGALGLARRHDGARFILILMLGYVLVVTLFFFNSRFRLPMMPFYFALAAGGGWHLATIVRRRWRSAAGPTLLVILSAWFCFAPPADYPDRPAVQGLVSKGLYEYHRGDVAAAMMHFHTAARLDPNFPELNLNLGAGYFRQGRADSAEACFEREIALHPGRPKAYYNLASLRLVGGRPDEALALTDRALAIAPYDITANLIRLRSIAADSGSVVDRLPAAVAQAALASEDDLFVLNEGAGLLVHYGDCPAALEFLRRAEVAPSPPIETDDLAFEPGFPHTEAALERERARTYYLLGFCHIRAGDLDRAVTFTELAIEHDSTLTEAYVNLYLGYRAQGRLATADSVLAEAARRFPDNETVRATTPLP